MVNLKDKANPGLRESVVSGDISAAKLATMSTEDMASEERKAQNQKIQEQNLFNSLAAGEQEAETDAFTCSRCKQVREILANILT
jgi:transcription elongation factor S-II